MKIACFVSVSYQSEAGAFFAAHQHFQNAKPTFVVPFHRLSSHLQRVLIFSRALLKSRNPQTRSFRAKRSREVLHPPGLVIRSGQGNNVIIVCPLEENMSFRPLHDRILVRRVESEEKTKGGIIIPDTAKEKPQEGEVIAVGPGARNDAGQVQALDVKVGDRILFGKWSGTEIKINGEDLLIMKESDVMGIIEAQTEQKKAA
jgi:chaperonin GroES